MESTIQISNQLQLKYTIMEKLQFTLVNDALKKNFAWLDRDIKKGERVYLYTGSTYGCKSEDGLAFTLDGQLPFFELPAGLLSIEYENKPYTIFLTEKSSGSRVLFAKQGPFNHMDLLTEIQNQKSSDGKHEEANILKTQIIKSVITHSLVPLQEIKPLF